MGKSKTGLFPERAGKRITFGEQDRRDACPTLPTHRRDACVTPAAARAALATNALVLMMQEHHEE